MMKYFVIFLSVLAGWNTMLAQEWQTNIDDAMEKAKSAEREIVLVFQGSDWCVPCMKLEREVWSSDAFKTHASNQYIMVQADFPRKKKNALSVAQNEANGLLAEQYNPGGIFPMVVKLSGDGNVLGRLGYEGVTAEEYIKLLDAL